MMHVRNGISVAFILLCLEMYVNCKGTFDIIKIQTEKTDTKYFRHASTFVQKKSEKANIFFKSSKKK